MFPLCAFVVCSKVKFTFTVSDCKNFHDELKEKSGHWKVKEDALDCISVKNTLWKRLWTCRQKDNRANV